ncbi:MAG: Do family serine endopeptidase [Candidatus Aminicenantes bacterium]
MKKTAIVALVSFFIGILLAGYVFVFLPERNMPQSFLNESPSSTSFLYASPTAQAKPELDFVRIADLVGPAVVRITAERVERRRVVSFFDDWGDDWWDRFFGVPRDREREYRSQVGGTGFFISSDGYLITNNHIVENAEKITITTLQENEYKAEVVGTDPPTDVALLKITEKNLPYVELGDSGRVKIGEWVLAIGNPLGFEHTVSAGIVSAKGRQGLQSSTAISYQDFIQTDAAINRGNSGGPLVNMKGEVIGITSMIASPTGGNIGIGFAIPSNLARKVVKQLEEKGKVVRGYLGVYPQDLSEEERRALDLKSRRGAFVTKVEPGAPADKAGFERYDVIIEFNNQPVKNSHDLSFQIAETAPGTKVDIKVIRDGKEKILTAKLEELSTGEEEEQASTSSGQDLGITVTSMTPRRARQLRFQTEEGVLITEVRRYSEAEQKGLRAGDIILEANRQEVRDTNDLEKIINRLKPGDGLILLLRRERDGESTEFIRTLKIPE